jgi:hypothetical protein
MKDNIDKWVFEIDLDDIRDEDYHDKEASETPCICCGKNIKNPRYMVHLLTSGMLVSSQDNFENSQGMFAIGASCKNKLPNNFYWKV